MIITIDGSAGTGKSTIAKKVADSLHFVYFDTGAMYRSFTYYVLKHKVDFDDEKKMEKLLETFNFDISHDLKGNKIYLVNGKDISEKIRLSDVTNNVSAISALPQVRKKLVALQRAFAKHENTVFEGRDMGTVVFPDADLKLFFTAKAKVRAERRTIEMQQKYPEKTFSFEQIFEEIKKRDHLDSTRKISPLKKAADAIEIDTTTKTIDQIVNIVLSYMEKVEKLKKTTIYPKMALFYRLVLFSAFLLVRIFYRHKVYGKEHYHPGGGMIAANHSSFLDPPLVAVSCPEEVYFLAKKYLFSIPILGRLIRKLNSKPVSSSASDASVFKQILKIIKEDKKIILFPEGERSSTGEIGQLQQGVAFLGVQSKSVIFPVYIHGAFEIWHKGKRFPKLWGRTACVFGSPIECKNFLNLPKKEAMKEIAKALESSFFSLKKWYIEGKKGSPP